MERLTIPDVIVDKKTKRRTIIDGSEVRKCAMEFYWRLKLEEDILGDDYDMARLRELVEADRDGRCVVLSEPMKHMVFIPGETDVYCPNCGETLSGGWPLSDADDNRKLCQCPHCGQAIDDTKCEACYELQEKKGEQSSEFEKEMKKYYSEELIKSLENYSPSREFDRFDRLRAKSPVLFIVDEQSELTKEQWEFIKNKFLKTE